MGKQSETELCRSRASKQSETEKARSWGWGTDRRRGRRWYNCCMEMCRSGCRYWGYDWGREGTMQAPLASQPSVGPSQPNNSRRVALRVGWARSPPSLSIPFPVQLLNVYHSTRASRERARETSWVRIRARSMECAERGVSSQLLAGTATQIRTPVLVPCDAP
jgi:hypothetical protein